MRIGIDVSQLTYANTGVANYLRGFIEGLLAVDKENQYVLFFSSLRRESKDLGLPDAPNVTLKAFKFPPSFLDLLWNILHIVPVETFIGPVDIFISSDWTEPPTKKAKKATILYDLIVYKAPNETAEKIIATQKRKLSWTKKECDAIFCISDSTRKDAMKILGIPENKLHVSYPGV